MSDDYKAQFVKPRSRLRWYHQVHEESEVEEKLNELADLGYAIDDPKAVEGSDVPGHRLYLISATRKECNCDCCRSAAERRRRRKRSAEASE